MIITYDKENDWIHVDRGDRAYFFTREQKQMLLDDVGDLAVNVLKEAGW